MYKSLMQESKLRCSWCFFGRVCTWYFQLQGWESSSCTSHLCQSASCVVRGVSLGVSAPDTSNCRAGKVPLVRERLLLRPRSDTRKKAGQSFGVSCDYWRDSKHSSVAVLLCCNNKLPCEKKAPSKRTVVGITSWRRITASEMSTRRICWLDFGYRYLVLCVLCSISGECF